METEALFNALTDFNKAILTNGGINKTFSDLLQINKTNQANNLRVISDLLGKLKETFADESSRFYIETTEQASIFSLYGLTKFYGEEAQKRINELIAGNTRVINWKVIQTYYDEFTTAQTRISQLIEYLKPLPKFSNALSEKDGIFEIIFDGKTAIDNIIQLKQQTEAWYLIINGYADFLDIKKEDITFFSISKNSPAKWKLNATLLSILLIVKISNGIVDIEIKTSHEKYFLENIKKLNLGMLDDEKTTMINTFQQYLDNTAKAEIDKLIDKEMKEHNFSHKEHGHKMSSLNTAINKQRDFINNGGTINFYLNSSVDHSEAVAKSLEEFERKKREYLQLQDSLKIKYLTDSTKSEEK